MRQKEKFRLAQGPCPCGGADVYADCCGRYHGGSGAFANAALRAPSAEALMRARYCAYAMGLRDYLLATWHPSTAPGDFDLPSVKWLSLEVLTSESTADAGVVEFVARCREGGRAQRLHETSRFVREAGKWYYIDGLIHAEGQLASDF
jgi:SEC-C motif domain protein